MPLNPRTHWMARCDLTRSVALVAPAVRLVVVQAWPRPGADRQTYPVVALRSVVVDHYTKLCRRDDVAPPGGGTHAEMVALGWQRCDRASGPREDLLIATAEYGLVTAGFALGDEPAHWLPVACPWPPEEDEHRLAPIVQRLRERAEDLADAGPTPRLFAGTAKGTGPEGE